MGFFGKKEGQMKEPWMKRFGLVSRMGRKSWEQLSEYYAEQEGMDWDSAMREAARESVDQSVDDAQVEARRTREQADKVKGTVAAGGISPERVDELLAEEEEAVETLEAAAVEARGELNRQAGAVSADRADELLGDEEAAANDNADDGTIAYGEGGRFPFGSTEAKRGEALNEEDEKLIVDRLLELTRDMRDIPGIIDIIKQTGITASADHRALEGIIQKLETDLRAEGLAFDEPGSVLLPDDKKVAARVKAKLEHEDVKDKLTLLQALIEFTALESKKASRSSGNTAGDTAEGAGSEPMRDAETTTETMGWVDKEKSHIRKALDMFEPRDSVNFMAEKITHILENDPATGKALEELAAEHADSLGAKGVKVGKDGALAEGSKLDEAGEFELKKLQALVQVMESFGMDVDITQSVERIKHERPQTRSATGAGEKSAADKAAA